ncbi:response regulator transcription factor [Pseudomonas sp. HR96]|uniref:response regulator transcription factor n=1 Tax=Pseudomonas sp. HR96 TaxID=1027966 RepID=UPI002A75943F|nr:response regulator transcription factor [Pseudomonas sp. HR96]WPP01561.1 response regulator transcription factor [Pseudomonas sp. HR96]
MRILVVEDNRDIMANIIEYLQLKGCETASALDGLTGLHLAATEHFDVIILDIMLPGIDGNQICRSLRASSKRHVPIIMLTARDELSDRLTGFKAGADDYVVKPFALSELLARIEALSRRINGGGRRVLQLHDLSYDLDTLEIRRAGIKLKLNPTNLKLLAILMQKSPAVVTRRELEDTLWGDDPPDSDSLRSNIHLLRRALDKGFDQPLLHTVHGVGFQLCVKSR